MNGNSMTDGSCYTACKNYSYSNNSIKNLIKLSGKNFTVSMGGETSHSPDTKTVRYSSQTIFKIFPMIFFDLVLMTSK